ncbi:hypothetical protein C7M84_003501 [Penaeus vannamei]|uniref:Uncharacterized protein n=1 Tax=Penaeus vannamei TaxID=6689 RepID=A0A423TMZ3_PENVA|nr:hypothetical protein C7M84_003501 [Penaeus vannamei]
MRNAREDARVGRRKLDLVSVLRRLVERGRALFFSLRSLAPRNSSIMRWNAGKILKVALPVALLAVFAFVTQPRNLSLLREDHNVTLVLSARQMKAMMEARQPKQTQHETKVDSKGDTRKEKPLLASEDIVVINNKVYDRNEVNLTALQTQTQTLKKVLVNKRENRTHLWPPTLELSDAAFLEHLDYSKYRPKERSVLRRRVGVFVERARRPMPSAPYPPPPPLSATPLPPPPGPAPCLSLLPRPYKAPTAPTKDCRSLPTTSGHWGEGGVGVGVLEGGMVGGEEVGG